MQNQFRISTVCGTKENFSETENQKKKHKLNNKSCENEKLPKLLRNCLSQANAMASSMI